MNLSNLIWWCIGLIISWAGVQNIDAIHRTVLIAQAKLVYESRTATWGSLRFLTDQDSQLKGHE